MRVCRLVRNEMKRILKHLALISLILPSQAQALTLKEALQETQSQSLQIQKAQSAVEEAQWKKIGTYSGFLPSLSVQANYLTTKEYMLVDVNLGAGATSIPQVLPTTIYTLRASVPLFDGFSSTRRWQAERTLESAAASDLEWTRFSAERQTVLTFYKALSSQVLREVAEQNLKALQDHLKDIQAFKKAGVSTNYDVLRAETQVSEAQSELLNTADNMELAKYKLGEALGKEVENRPLEGRLPTLAPGAIANLKDGKTESRGDLQALTLKSEASHLNYQSANKYWVPKLAFVGELNRYNNRNDRFNDTAAFRDSYWAGLNLTWNLFDGMASTARSGQSEQQAAQMEKNLQISKIKARQDFEFWKRKFLYFCTIYKARASDILRSEEAVRLATVGRRAGVRTAAELLDAESDLYRARAGQVTAQIGAIEALINLEMASGQKLFDFNEIAGR